MEISVDTRELIALERRLALAGKANTSNIRKMLTIIGNTVHGTAVKYAPRSMTKTEYQSTLKGRGSKQFGAKTRISFGSGGTLVGKSTHKSKQSADKFTSRQLKDSITKEVFDDRVEIGVPSNSKAQAYAEKIHDEKGKTWNKIGWQNDANATDKYIEKAEQDESAKYMKAVDDYVDSIIRGI